MKKKWFNTLYELLNPWERYERYVDLKKGTGGKLWTFFEWLEYSQ